MVDWKPYLLPAGQAEVLGVKSMVIDPFIPNESLFTRLKRRFLPLLDGKIMEAAAETDAPHLDNAQSPPLRPVVDGQLFEQHDAMRDGMKL